MIKIVDVSHHQDPKLWDWDNFHRSFSGLVARASYGSGTKDRQFLEYAKQARSMGSACVFGAYHFFRQTQTAKAQFDLFKSQIDAIGGLLEENMYPVLDLEDNRTNGDGKVDAKLFNTVGRELCEMMIEEWGGCIIYMSSYFPDSIGANIKIRTLNSNTAWLQYCNWWLADYGYYMSSGNARSFVPTEPGKPRSPYGPWAIHQHKPRPTALYADGKLDVDQNVVNPNFDVDLLRCAGMDISFRPGGALPEDDHSLRCNPPDFVSR